MAAALNMAAAPDMAAALIRPPLYMAMIRSAHKIRIRTESGKSG
jgi:hypothetical protein